MQGLGCWVHSAAPECQARSAKVNKFELQHLGLVCRREKKGRQIIIIQTTTVREQGRVCARVCVLLSACARACSCTCMDLCVLGVARVHHFRNQVIVSKKRNLSTQVAGRGVRAGGVYY